jgi:hypothetical protein
VIANAKTYVHLNTTREWLLVQDQSASGIGGGQFAADFKRTPALPLKLSTQQDGSVVIGTPPPGYNAHFWIIDRGTYAARSVDGVYVQMDVKTSDPNMKFVANVGADWWRDESAKFVQNFANNPGVGMSNWVELDAMVDSALLLLEYTDACERPASPARQIASANLRGYRSS